MPKFTKRSQKTKPNEPEALKGWHRIAKFLGQPVATAQRWAKRECLSLAKVGT